MPPRTRQTQPKPAAKQPTPDGPVTLDQLSPEDRERLLAEARAEAALASGEPETASEDLVERRNAVIAEMLDDRDHLRECPGGRVEAYAATKPARPSEGEPAKPVTVVRCIECGGSTVIGQTYTATVAQLEAALAD